MRFHTLACAAVLCVPCWGQWSTGSLSVPRGNLGATSVGSTALFAGGFQNSGVGSSDAVDLYDAQTGTWSAATLSQRLSAVRAASAGGKAVFYGYRNSSQYQPLVDIFNEATGTWSTTMYPGPNPEILPAATGSGNKIYFGGGNNPHNPGISERVEIYDTGTGVWSSDVLSMQRSQLSATSVGDLVLFAGGNYSGSAVAVVDILDTITHTWSVASLSQARILPAATSVGGKALFAGGSSDPQGHLPLDRVDIYDASTGTWSQATLSEPRSLLSATTLGPYAIFAGGRLTVTPNEPFRSDRVDIYDSRTGSWSTATLSEARSKLAATTVNGLALIGGGEWNSAVVDILGLDPGLAYCASAAPNSSGLPGILRAEGLLSVGANDLLLIAEQLPPGQFGYFITGLSQGFIQPPGSQGPICLSGNIGRYNHATEIIQGPAGSLQLDLTSMPVNPPVAVLPGDTWNFQCWYRDVNPGPTSNTTNGLAVTFTTIGDPSVQFAITQASRVENATQMEVRVTLSQPTDQDVLVPYSTAGSATDGVDWRVEELNPFTIPAGSTGADMTLIIAEDPLQEPDELAIVSLGTPVGAVLGTATTFTLTIVNDD